MSAARGQGLRLALFTDTFAPQLNGVSRTLERLVAAVRASGGEVCTWTASDPAAEHSDAVRRLPSVLFWAYPQLRIAWPLARRVVPALRAFAPDLVHVATPFGVGLAGHAAARRLEVPFVTSYHTSFSDYARFYRLGVLSAPGWRYLRWFHNGGRRTYCPTRAVQRDIAAHGFRRTRLWGRGVDTLQFHPSLRSMEVRRRVFGASDDAIIVAYVGRLAAEKGLDTALAAMRLVTGQATQAFVFGGAGDGPYRAACEALAPPGSVFAGWLEGEPLAAFYAAADIFVFPSTTDTFGNVLLEAMASGVPIVAADVPPTRELLADGERGVLVPPADPAAFARALLDLGADAERRRRLAASGLAAARRQSWEAVFAALLADYQQVSRRRSGRSPAAPEPWAAEQGWDVAV